MCISSLMFASGRLSTDREMSYYMVRFFLSYPFFFSFLLFLSSHAGFLLLKVVGKINLWCIYTWTVLIIRGGSVEGTRTLVEHKLYGR